MKLYRIYTGKLGLEQYARWGGWESVEEFCLDVGIREEEAETFGWRPNVGENGENEELVEVEEVGDAYSGGGWKRFKMKFGTVIGRKLHIEELEVWEWNVRDYSMLYTTEKEMEKLE